MHKVSVSSSYTSAKFQVWSKWRIFEASKFQKVVRRYIERVRTSWKGSERRKNEKVSQVEKSK
jgi:hypothetical protein